MDERHIYKLLELDDYEQEAIEILKGDKPQFGQGITIFVKYCDYEGCDISIVSDDIDEAAYVRLIEILTDQYLQNADEKGELEESISALILEMWNEFEWRFE